MKAKTILAIAGVVSTLIVYSWVVYALVTNNWLLLAGTVMCGMGTKVAAVCISVNKEYAEKDKLKGGII